MNTSVICIMATFGRHALTERAIGSFLNQDYPHKHLLIYQNSSISQSLDGEYPNITLVNNHIDPITGEEFKTLGAIYNAVFEYIKNDPHLSSFNLVNFADNDDYAMPDHISEGVKGYHEGMVKAYKPKKSWSLYFNHTELAENTMEPSIFVNLSHVLEYGCSNTTTDQHLQWVKPLGWDDIFVDPNGKPTLVYDWSGQFSSSDSTNWKTSGDAANPNNFKNCRDNSWDHGDRVYTPWTKEQLEPYYKRITDAILQ